MEEFYFICALVLAAILGVSVGSFLNVVIYRVPLSMSLSRPASHCPNCKYKLRFYDNIPVLSYLILGGRCRSCKTHISFRYTAVEILNGVLWVLSVLLFWKESIPLAILYALAFSVLISVFFIDLEHKLIFDRFQVILLCLGAGALFFDEVGLVSHLIGGVGGFLALWLVSLLFERITGKEGLGGGDVKLVSVMGLMMGWEKLLLSLLVATLPAAIIMPLLMRGKQGEAAEFPFAPFLVIGFAVSLLFGKEIIEWYLSLLGISI